MYFVTVLDIKNNKISSQNTVGFFFDLDVATSSVLSNSLDIFENGSYNYAVITEITEGFYQLAEEIQWFSCTHDDASNTFSYNKIERPKLPLNDFGLNYVIEPF